MLHDDQRVSEILKSPERGKQLVIVALMQTNARFVEYVCHTHKPRADLGGKTDALGFTAGEGSGGACQRKIIKPHIHEEFYSRLYLFYDEPADQKLLRGKPGLYVLHEGRECLHRHGSHFVNVFVGNGDSEGFLFQSLSAAARTWRDAHKLLILGFHHLGGGFAVSSLHVLDESVKRDIVHSDSALSAVVNLHLLSTGAVDQNVVYILGIILKRGVQ